MKETLQQAWQWISLPQNLMIGVGVLVPIYLVGLFIHSYALSVPFVDQWHQSAEIAILIESGDVQVSDFFTPINGHISIFSYFVTALNTLLFDWNLRAEAFFNLVLALGCYGLLLLNIAKLYPHLTRWLAVPLAGLIFSIHHFEIWIYGIGNTFLFPVLFFLLGCTVLIYGRAGWQTVLLAAVCSLCSLLAFGAGIVTWGAFLIGMVVLGYRHWGYYAAWVGFTLGAGLLFIQLTSQETVESQFKFSLTPSAIMMASEMFLALMGNPFSNYDYEPTISIIMGIMGICLGAINLWLLRKAITRRQLALILILSAFSVGASLLIIVSRFSEEDYLFTAISSRYGFTSTPFGVAVIITQAFMLQWSQAQRWIKQANIIIIGILIIGYAQANIAVLQTVQMAYSGRALDYRYLAPTTAEDCVLNYPLRRNQDCLQNLPFTQSIKEYKVERIAAYNLAGFADHYPTQILPLGYETDDAVILQAPNIWASYYIHQTLLYQTPQDQLYSLLPDTPQDYDVPYPTRLKNHSQYPDKAFLENIHQHNPTQQVWYIGFGEHFEPIKDYFLQEGYSLLVVAPQHPFYRVNNLTIGRFLRPNIPLEDRYRFRDLRLLGWELNTYTLNACDELQIDSWWIADNVMSEQLVLTTVLVNAQTGALVAQSDGLIGGIATNFWEPDRYYFDRRHLKVNCEATAGDYNLLVGIYNGLAQTDLPIALGDGTAIESNRAYLTTVTLE